MSKLLKSKKLNTQSGFTLIELLVVIGIIAVLAAIVLIAINPARQFRQARDAQRHSDVNAILNAIGQNIADNKGSVPGEVPAAGATPAEKISTAESNLCDTLVPTYIPALPVDPSVDADGGGPLKKGQGIPKSNCGTSYDTGYTILTDTTANGGRITIEAPGKEESADPIKVTR